jgi:defect-in-organelle-trafficking protein DotC
VKKNRFTYSAISAALLLASASISATPFYAEHLSGGTSSSEKIKASPVKTDRHKSARTKPSEISIDSLIENEARLENPSREIENLRVKTIKQAAFTVGLQTGTNERYEEINEHLEDMDVTLDQLYDFTHLMVDRELIPPIIYEANDTMRYVSNDEAVSTVTTYEIAAKAKVGRPPNWRDYLIQLWPAPKKINSALSPQNGDEERVFKKAFLSGWDEGQAQADQLFQDSMNALTADFTGMARYHLLVDTGVISKPVLAKGEQEVVINGETMSVGSTLYRITTKTKYQSVDKWTPRISSPTNH